MLLEGIFLPLTLPFHPDGRLFQRKLEANVARYSLTPAAGLIVCRQEADSLTDAETVLVLEAAMRTAAEIKVMIASIGRASLLRTLALGTAAALAGYDAVAVTPPWPASGESMQAETMNYFSMVADRSELPVIIDCGAMPNAWTAALAGHPNVAGAIASDVAALVSATRHVKRQVTVTNVFAAATGRMLQRGSGLLSAANLASGTALPAGAPAVKTRTKTVGFQVLARDSATMLSGWSEGASGAVPLLGPCAPQACCEVWQAFRDNDLPLAEEKQNRILQAAAPMEGPRGVAWIKHGCDLNGYFGGSPRLPLLPLEGDQKAQLARLLANLKT